MLKKYCLILFFICFIPSLVTSQNNQNTYISISIEGQIKDEVHQIPLFSKSSATSLRFILSLIDKAKNDSKVNGIILKINSPNLGFAKLQEIRSAIKEFQGSGKKVFTYSYALSNKDYLLSSVADKIYISPQGGIELTGIAIELVFLKKTFDLLGITPNFIQIGDYKSAKDPFTNYESNNFQKEMTNRILDGLYDEIVKIVSSSRNIPIQTVKKLIDKGYFTSEEAKKANLIDDFLYEDQFEDLIKKEKIIVSNYNIKQNNNKNGNLSLIKILSMMNKKTPKVKKIPHIAVVFAQGVIITGQSKVGLFESEAIGSDDYIEIFRHLRTNTNVKGVILRIDSPGGSALASDIMWREIKLLSQVKPVIASLSDMATSGGYYIAMGCPTIIANPSTITGSIGVVGGKFNLKGLYDKLGVTKEIFKRGKFADLSTDYRDWNEEELKLIQKMMTDTYKDFVTKSSKSRKLTYDQMHELAQGKIYTGTQALKAGLIDKLGGLQTAISLIRKQIGNNAKKLPIVSYPEQKTFIELLQGNMQFKKRMITEFRQLKELMGPILWYFSYLDQILTKEKIAVLNPYFIQYK